MKKIFDYKGKELNVGDIIYGAEDEFDGGEIIVFDGEYCVKNYHCLTCPLPNQKDRKLIIKKNERT